MKSESDSQRQEKIRRLEKIQEERDLAIEKARQRSLERQKNAAKDSLTIDLVESSSGSDGEGPVGR